MAKMFFPQYAKGRKEGIDLIVGKSILEHIKKIGKVEIDSECGGKGTCCKDIIRVDEGKESLSKLSNIEKSFLKHGELKPNHRLACQSIVTKNTKDIRIFISSFGKYTILTDTIKTDVELAPSVFSSKGKVFYNTGKNLGAYQGGIYGLAIDVGTTTLVMQVVDLEKGKNIGNPIASKNPQIAYGNDVISRIGHTIENKHLWAYAHSIFSQFKLSLPAVFPTLHLNIFLYSLFTDSNRRYKVSYRPNTLCSPVYLV